MHTETQTAALVPAELDQEISRTGLAQESVALLRNAYAPHFAAFVGIEEAALAVPQDAPDVARAMRMRLKSIRVDAEKTRRALKEDSLRRGQAIDGVNRLLLERLKPLEERMDAIERVEEIARKARIAALQAAREEQMAPYAEHCLVMDLATLFEEQFTALLARCKESKEAAEAAEAFAQAERLAREEADRQEREGLRAEAERLAAEAAAEREARRAAEAELARKAEEERRVQEAARRAEVERLAAERAAAAAPDVDKLRAFARVVRALSVPEFESEAGCELREEIDVMVERFARWLDGKALTLGTG